MITFKKTREDYDDEPQFNVYDPDVKISVQNDVNIDVVVEAFNHFIKSMGFSQNYKAVIMVGDKEFKSEEAVSKEYYEAENEGCDTCCGENYTSSSEE